MAAFLQLHSITIGQQKYYFLARPETYTGDIGTATGISLASDAEQGNPDTIVEKLVSKGKLFRLSASYKAGTKNRSVKLLCSAAKLAGALNDLDGATYTDRNGSGGKLTSVRVSQKAIFSY